MFTQCTIGTVHQELLLFGTPVLHHTNEYYCLPFAGSDNLEWDVIFCVAHSLQLILIPM